MKANEQTGNNMGATLTQTSINAAKAVEYVKNEEVAFDFKDLVHIMSGVKAVQDIVKEQQQAKQQTSAEQKAPQQTDKSDKAVQQAAKSDKSPKKQSGPTLD